MSTFQTTLAIPTIPRLVARPTSNYHIWAESIRSSLILADPLLWTTITSGRGTRTEEEHELLNVRACAWIYLHLHDDIMNFLRPKKLDMDARGLWEAIREQYAPEACREGINMNCGCCSGRKMKFVGVKK